MTSPSSSTASLTKDFQAAFTRLQSTYGLGFTGSPAPPSAPSSSRVVRASTAPNTIAAPAQSAPKDFHSALARLQSRYGGGGGAPTPVPRTNAKRSSAAAIPQASTPAPTRHQKKKVRPSAGTIAL
ncbi:hypothetical protein DFH07DRAFT_950347 [Mycena maculata]|uniref:Uncharacterized protein n=1 Tax=Mycena maculata TaxID=230809 RepID=A0AAD7NXX1_9AGAR|nr:hypothetical protein DFH07DRAFT_950347 [Mycena maculata]